MPREGERALWRIGNVCVHIAGIIAIGSLLIQLSEKGLAVGKKKSQSLGTKEQRESGVLKREDVFISVYEIHRWDLLLHDVPRERG